MDDNVAIKVENVSKVFRLPHEKQTSVKGALISLVRGGKRTYEKQEVLKNISFEIKKGEFFGIVGRNGSGKSTLLKMLAGIYSPTEGSIHINGKLTPFIELGVGFNPELTGRENVYLNGALLGFSRKEMSAMYDDIVSFAEIEKFMDQKLKNYSSGMQVRLAFSIAIRAKSDILLIDEVLAVGDAAFQTKCFDYFQELKKTDTTVVFVSHDRASLERFCERGILINNGELLVSGSISDVLTNYSSIVLEQLDKIKIEPNAKNKQPTIKKRAIISGTQVQSSKGTVNKKFTYGDDIFVQYKVEFKEEITNPIMGITLWKKNVENAIYATNTLISGDRRTGTFRPGDTVTLKTKLPNDINDGEYFIEPALANESVTVFYDKTPFAANFFISGSNNPHSLINSTNKVEIIRK